MLKGGRKFLEAIKSQRPDIIPPLPLLMQKLVCEKGERWDILGKLRNFINAANNS